MLCIIPIFISFVSDKTNHRYFIPLDLFQLSHFNEMMESLESVSWMLLANNVKNVKHCLLPIIGRNKVNLNSYSIQL